MSGGSGDGPRRDREPVDDESDGSGDEPAADAPGDDGAPGDASETSEDAPLSDLRQDVDERRGREDGDSDDDDDFEELFAEMEVGDVDEAEVWAELEESADEPMVDSETVGGDAALGDATAVATAADERGDQTVVEKSLCHGCPHFADPPDTACTHDGTTIEAAVDTEHFRVRDCPVVARREAEDPSDFSADPE